MVTVHTHTHGEENIIPQVNMVEVLQMFCGFRPASGARALHKVKGGMKKKTITWQSVIQSVRVGANDIKNELKLHTREWKRGWSRF